MAQFNFSFEPGTADIYVQALETAGEIWSGHLGDDVEVNVHFEAASLEENMLGGAIPAFEFQTAYQDVRTGLATDANLSIDDATAIANLPDTANDSALLQGGAFANVSYGAYSTTTTVAGLPGTTFDAVLDGNTLQGDALSLTRANAKAIGLVESDSSALDGVVLLNSDINWALDGVSSSAAEPSVDLLSVALHELGHILGFVSGLDSFGTYERAGNNGNGRGLGPTILIDSATATDFTSPLDLFRYTNASAASGAIDLTVGEDAYFSVDGGSTRLTDFATGAQVELGGDGYQASHWEANSDDGILDAVLRYGEQASISANDLQAFDAIGYEIAAAAGGVDLSAAAAAAQASVSQATFANRDADIVSLLANSEIYEQWGWGGGGSGGGSGGGGGGGGGNGYGQLLGIFNQLLGAPDGGESAAAAEAGATEATDAAVSPEAEAAGGGATPSLGGMSADALLGMAPAQLSGFSEDSDLEADASAILESDSEGESAPSYQDVLANSLGLLGSDDGVLGDALASPLVGGMLAEMLPQIGVTGEQTFFYGGAFQGSDA